MSGFVQQNIDWYKILELSFCMEYSLLKLTKQKLHEVKCDTVIKLIFVNKYEYHQHKHQGLVPIDPFRLQGYSGSRQRFLGRPIDLLPCGLQLYDFRGIRFCGILCVCRSRFFLYSSILSNMLVIRNSLRVVFFVLWSQRVKPARGLNNFISAASKYEYTLY